MIKKINVIDLDKTLIPFDSFRSLIKKEILDLNFGVIFYAVLRWTRLISSDILKKRIMVLLENEKDDFFFKNFALDLYHKIDARVLIEIQKHTDDTTINILLSASPNLYVKYLIEELGWTGSGSYMDKNHFFFHLHGENKIKWILTNYNPDNFVYYFSISDSSSDEKLLSLFKNKIKWTLE